MTILGSLDAGGGGGMTSGPNKPNPPNAFPLLLFLIEPP